MQSLSQPHLTAEQIAHGLPNCRKQGKYSWRTECPACGGQNLTITDKNGKALFKCWNGCNQKELIHSFQRHGLWRSPSTTTATVHQMTSRATMVGFCLSHEALMRKCPEAAHSRDRRQYQQYQRILCSPYTPGEVAEAHLYCLAYSADVRRGLVPGPDADRKFLALQKIVAKVGSVPREW